MQLVEQHVIKQADARYQAIDQASSARGSESNAACFVRLPTS